MGLNRHWGSTGMGLNRPWGSTGMGLNHQTTYYYQGL